jgi:hypothetical protein
MARHSHERLLLFGSFQIFRGTLMKIEKEKEKVNENEEEREKYASGQFAGQLVGL